MLYFLLGVAIVVALYFLLKWLFTNKDHTSRKGAGTTYRSGYDDYDPDFFASSDDSDDGADHHGFDFGGGHSGGGGADDSWDFDND